MLLMLHHQLFLLKLGKLFHFSGADFPYLWSDDPKVSLRPLLALIVFDFMKLENFPKWLNLALAMPGPFCQDYLEFIALLSWRGLRRSYSSRDLATSGHPDLYTCPLFMLHWKAAVSKANYREVPTLNEDVQTIRNQHTKISSDGPSCFIGQREKSALPKSPWESACTWLFSRSPLWNVRLSTWGYCTSIYHTYTYSMHLVFLQTPNSIWQGRLCKNGCFFGTDPFCLLRGYVSI